MSMASRCGPTLAIEISIRLVRVIAFAAYHLGQRGCVTRVTRKAICGRPWHLQPLQRSLPYQLHFTNVVARLNGVPYESSRQRRPVRICATTNALTRYEDAGPVDRDADAERSIICP